MLEQGLIDEVEKLARMGCTRENTAMQGIGYKEVLDFLEGKTSFEEMAEEIKQATRRYAKRQITWFKRRQGAVFISMDKLKGSAAKTVIDKCEDFLNG